MVIFGPQSPLEISYCLGLREMESYYEFIERYLNQVIEDNENSIKEINNEVSERLINMGYDETELVDQDEENLAHLADMGNDYDFYQEALYEVKIFQSTFRTSFLIACCSNFEYQLNNICKKEQKNKSLKLGYNDMSGQGIDQAKNYFRKVIGVDISLDKSWQEVTNIKKIRNKLVHNNGVLEPEKSDKEIKEYISHRPDLSIVNDTITISADYNKHVIETFYNFLNNVIFDIYEEKQKETS